MKLGPSQGNVQNWLIDLRPLLLRRDVLDFVAKQFWANYEAEDAFQIAGLESVAIPVLTSIVMTVPDNRSDLNAVIIRKDRKPTGLGNLIEGQLTADPVILIDDIFNSGRSAEKAVVAAEREGNPVTDIFVLIDYRSRAGAAWRDRRHVRVRSLFTLEDFELALKEDDAPVPSMRKVWSAAIKGGFPFHLVPKSAPVYAEGRIFRGCDAGFMQAFDAKSGTILWQHQARGTSRTKGIWSTPAVYQGKLVYGAYNGVV